MTGQAEGLSWQVKSIAAQTGDVGASNGWLALAMVLGTILVVTGFISVLGMALIYIERRVAAHFQCRVGPNRVGPFGLLQTVADTIKLLLKEDIVPTQADGLLHIVAPAISFAGMLLVLVALPMSPQLQVVDLNIGVVYVTAVSGLGVLGILLGGWSSNNKWSLLGAMRAGAQIISYEVSATLALLVVVVFAGTLQLSGIVLSQQEGWWIWRAHGSGIAAFIVFVIAGTAEINRTPFDLAEGESELTAGFHTEYSGLRFAFFFLSEFLNMFVLSAMAATLFLGGWMPLHIGHFAGFNQLMDLIPPGVWFATKTAAMIFVLMWFRWTFPRLRVDQLMRLEWKVLLPIGFVNLFLAAILVVTGLYFFPTDGIKMPASSVPGTLQMGGPGMAPGMGGMPPGMGGMPGGMGGMPGGMGGMPGGMGGMPGGMGGMPGGMGGMPGGMGGMPGGMGGMPGGAGGMPGGMGGMPGGMGGMPGGAGGMPGGAGGMPGGMGGMAPGSANQGGVR
jgi:NADH-quinone oxidoreductase subunit H